MTDEQKHSGGPVGGDGDDPDRTPPYGTRVPLDPDERESVGELAATYGKIAAFLHAIAAGGGRVADAHEAARRIRRLGDSCHDHARWLEEFGG